METIMVATDFTESSENTIQCATNLSLQLKTNLTIFHAYQVPVAYSDIPVVTLSLEELRRHAEEKMHYIKDKIEKYTNNKIQVKTKIILGEPANELIKICQEINPLLLVMGTGNSNAVERTFIGSTALHAIHHLKTPIFILPTNARFTKIKKVGFACDFMKVEANTPSKQIEMISKSYDAELHILHVETKKDKKYLEPQKQILEKILKSLKPTFHEIQSDDVEKGIHQFCIDNSIDILFMIPKNHNLVERIFKKRHVKEIIFHSDIPILCIHE